ncbi:MAG: sigma-70 family RNA polymerase sigma factor [Gemmatimonadota bacterium]
MIAGLAAGDPAALESLMAAYWVPLHRYATRLLKDRDIAQDLTQEAFLRAWERRAKLGSGSIRGFLYRVVHNLAIDEIRRRRVRSLWISSTSAGPTPEPGFAEQEGQDEETHRAIVRAIDSLPARRRKAFVLAYLHRLSYREIGGIMDVSPATIKNQIAAALAQLRELLRPHLNDMLDGSG